MPVEWVIVNRLHPVHEGPEQIPYGPELARHHPHCGQPRFKRCISTGLVQLPPKLADFVLLQYDQCAEVGYELLQLAHPDGHAGSRSSSDIGHFRPSADSTSKS